MEIPDTLSQAMLKMYRKQNTRRIKKGKAPLTQEEFLIKHEKECNSSEKMAPLLFICIPLILIAIFTGGIMLTEGFSTMADLVFFLAFICIFEGIVFYFVWKLTKSSIASKRAWIAECRKNPQEWD